MTDAQFTVAQALGWPHKTQTPNIEVQVIEFKGTRDRKWENENWVDHQFIVQDATGQILLEISKLSYVIEPGMILRCGPGGSASSLGTHVRIFRSTTTLSTYGDYLSVLDGWGGVAQPKTPVAVAAPVAQPVREHGGLLTTTTKTYPPMLVAPVAGGFVPAGPAVAAAVPSQPVAQPSQTGYIAPAPAAPAPVPAPTTATEAGYVPRKRLDVAEARHVQEWLFLEWCYRFRKENAIDDQAVAAMVNTITIAFLNGRIDKGDLDDTFIEPSGFDVQEADKGPPDLDHEGEPLPPAEPEPASHPLGPGPRNEPDWPK